MWFCMCGCIENILCGRFSLSLYFTISKWAETWTRFEIGDPSQRVLDRLLLCVKVILQLWSVLKVPPCQFVQRCWQISTFVWMRKNSTGRQQLEAATREKKKKILDIMYPIVLSTSFGLFCVPAAFPCDNFALKEKNKPTSEDSETLFQNRHGTDGKYPTLYFISIHQEPTWRVSQSCSLIFNHFILEATSSHWT